MKTTKNLYVMTILAIVLGLLLGMLGENVIAGEKKTANATAAAQLAVSQQDIERFARVIAQIKQYYIKPIDDKTLFDYAIKGMLSQLDPHSAYLDEATLKDLQVATDGKFGGVGIEVMPDPEGYLRVISPLDGSPAEKAGMKAGDIIVRIDGKLVKDVTVSDAINLMRGEKGSKVVLTVLRKGEPKPLTFTLTRSIIKMETVKSKLLEKGYGYVRIAFFQTNAPSELKKAVIQLQNESGGQLKGLVLDLRNNPGGLLDSAIGVADLFLDANNLKTYQRNIVYTKGRVSDNDVVAKATSSDLLKGVPIVILINGGSASASEIVAGALQDYKRAIILGTKSFGKGSVQTVIPIDGQTGVKLTTALYYTPAGRSIQAKGIEPDVVVADLKLPKESSQSIVFDPVSETDLKDHLENQQPSNEEIKAAIGKTDQAETSLAHQDYQLYEALVLLKGLNVLQR